MENQIKVFSFIALTALVGFIFIACPSNNDTCNHTGGTATCTTKAICSKCSEPYGNLADHTWNEYIITTFPTETTDGEETSSCSVCNDLNKQSFNLATFQTFFYGKWKRDDPSSDYWDIFEFSETEINYIDSNGYQEVEQIVNLGWVYFENSKPSTKTEYPYGFRIQASSEYRFFIHSNKMSLDYWGGNDPFIKQP